MHGIDTSKPQARRLSMGGSRQRCFLCQFAGADMDILAICPEPDRRMFATIGAMLLMVFAWICGTTSLGLITAYGHDAGSVVTCIVAGGFIAGLAIAADRFFIMADWIVEGEHALAIRKRPSSLPGWLARSLILAVRISVASIIATTTASLFELYVFRDGIDQQLERDHFTENRGVYEAIDERKRAIDAELSARQEQVALVIEQEKRLVSDLATLRSTGMAAADPEVALLVNKLKGLQSDEKSLRSSIQGLEQDEICERLGEQCRAGNSGREGTGRKWQVAVERLELARRDLKAVETKIADVERQISERSKAITDIGDAEQTSRAAAEKKLSDELEAVRKLHDSALKTLKEETGARDARITEYTQFLQSQPDFVPLTKGVAERMTAKQKILEASPAAASIAVGFKWGLVALEVLAILTKLIASPRSEYSLQAAARYHLCRYELKAQLDDADAEATRRNKKSEDDRRRREQGHWAHATADRAWAQFDEGLTEAFSRKRTTSTEKGTRA